MISMVVNDKCMHRYRKKKKRLLKVSYVPATTATFLPFFLLFLLCSLTMLIKQTRQAVCAIKQSILPKKITFFAVAVL